jgi:hypothetical protein
MQAAPTSTAAMAARHRVAHARAARSRPAPAPMRRNLQPVLTLGDEEFILFRGRAYGVPPVPLKEGEELLEAYLAALHAARAMATAALEQNDAPELRAAYFGAMRRIPALLWALTREPRPILRLLRAWGLRRNPYLDATEAELLELAGFFYARRTRSGVQSPQTSSRGRRISSTT